MSRCEERTSDILLYLDNALSGQKLEDFRAHLAVCSNCRNACRKSKRYRPCCVEHDHCIWRHRRFAPV